MADNATTTDAIAAMAREHANLPPGTLPDLRKVASVLEDVDINAVCLETGLTPLLWTIEHDSPLISFILSQGADVTVRGTGAFAKAPIELALEKRLQKRAEQLVARGAPCAPEVAEAIAERRRAATRMLEEHKQIEKALEKSLKTPEFVDLARQLGERLGVAPKKPGRRKGYLAMKGVPVRKLASSAGASEGDWISALNGEIAASGASIFASDPIEEKAKIELCLVPTRDKRQIVAISQLLTGELSSPLERMEHADILDALALDHPFTLIGCGRLGVLGKPDPATPDPEALATRLFDICGELLGYYQQEHDRQHGIMPPAPQPDREQMVQALAADIKKDGVWWLPWGVEL